MNIKLLSVVLTVAGALVACGDSTGSGGTGAGGSSNGGNGGTPVEGGGGGTGGTPVEGGGGSGTGGAGGGASCEEQYPAGYATAATVVIQYCGCADGSPCATQCADDDACVTPGPETSIQECGDCVQMQAGNQATCALMGVGSDDCDADCQSYVACTLGGG